MVVYVVTLEDDIDRLNEEDAVTVSQIIEALSKDDPKKLVEALSFDNPKELIELETCEFFSDRRRYFKLDSKWEPCGWYAIDPSLVLKWTVDHRALRCAEYMYSSLSHAVSLEHPIHAAVTEFLPEFVKLILQHSSTVDGRGRRPGTDYYLMRPIEAALKKLSKKISWTPAQSVYQLIFSLCGLRELGQAFFVISQVMRVSNLNREAIYNYAKEGWIIELTILLYVDAIYELGILKGLSEVEFSALCQSAVFSISTVSKEEIYYVVDGKGVIVPMGKEQVAKCTLKLLTIFYRTKFSTASQEKGIDDAAFELPNDNLQNLVFGDNVAAAEVVKHLKTMDDPLSGHPFKFRPIGMLNNDLSSNPTYQFRQKGSVASADQTLLGSQRPGSNFTSLDTRTDAQGEALRAINRKGSLRVRTYWLKLYSKCGTFARRINYALK